MKAIVLGAAAAALAIGSAAAAQTPVHPPQTPIPVTEMRATANTDPNKLICEKVEEIGSRVAKRRVCLTAEQWKEKHREQAEFAEDIQSGTWGIQSDPANEAFNGPGGGAGPP